MRLLVRSFLMTSCTLANLAIRARARVRSSSCALPISYKARRQIVCMRSNIPCIMSITRCRDESSQLSSAFLGRDLLGADTTVGDTSTPSDPSSRCNTACLASRRSRSWSCITGRTRSEAVFQWSLDGGLRVIANFRLWKSSGGIISGTYSYRGEKLSPRRWGKLTW